VQDVSDSQYHTFRENLPYMAALLLFHPILRNSWNKVFPCTVRGRSSSLSQAESRLEQRTSFDYAFALLFLIALHGFSALKVLLILYANYRIGTILPRKYVPGATWIFNVCVLFANELCEGYKFKSMASLVTPPPTEYGIGDIDPYLVRWGTWLDSWGGLMSRWEILFNITILRLISFNMDRYWSGDKAMAVSLEVIYPILVRSDSSDVPKKKQLDPANLSEKDRITIPADASDYSWRNYVAYAVYAPLYLTGPILTFNDYISQAKYRPASIETPRTVRYGIRFILVLLAMEVILHYDYVGAISHANPTWGSYTAAQLSLLSYFNLHLIWLKLLIPWRLFRLWALIDGIDPPENMIRCVSNNYSTQSFWRAWHRSYYRWLLRYIYIPLGGSSFQNWQAATRSISTFLLVFTFVALWHDIQLRLLIWGWLIVLFMMPEVISGYVFPRRKWESRPTAYRMLCCAGGVFNVLMMMMANLVGYAVGLDGLNSIISGILQDWSGKLFLVLVVLGLSILELTEWVQAFSSWSRHVWRSLLESKSCSRSGSRS
jgi:protein-cysteine N-palmitoyltransferase HHAT